MQKLIATFKVELPGSLLLRQLREEELHIKFRIENFDIEISLIPNGSRFKKRKERHWTFSISEVKIAVSRNEPTKPPKAKVNDKEQRDLSEQTEYFGERLDAYKKAAATSFNRLMSFFKYRLLTPQIEHISHRHPSLNLPKWSNEKGEEVGKGPFIYLISHIESEYLRIWAKALKPTDVKELTLALTKSIKPKLYQEILSDAQNAILDKNYRRAILEMAIACETAVKETFFKKFSAASAAYEYFEDKGKISIRIVELIDKVANEAFGESFKTLYPDEFQNIDYLYRCRNKIAHRGNAIFRDNAGLLHTANERTLINWWDSLNVLLKWLKKHRNK